MHWIAILFIVVVTIGVLTILSVLCSYWCCYPLCNETRSSSSSSRQTRQSEYYSSSADTLPSRMQLTSSDFAKNGNDSAPLIVPYVPKPPPPGFTYPFDETQSEISETRYSSTSSPAPGAAVSYTTSKKTAYPSESEISKTPYSYSYTDEIVREDPTINQRTTTVTSVAPNSSVVTEMGKTPYPIATSRNNPPYSYSYTDEIVREDPKINQRTTTVTSVAPKSSVVTEISKTSYPPEPTAQQSSYLYNSKAVHVDPKINTSATDVVTVTETSKTYSPNNSGHQSSYLYTNKTYQESPKINRSTATSTTVVTPYPTESRAAYASETHNSIKAAPISNKSTSYSSSYVTEQSPPCYLDIWKKSPAVQNQLQKRSSQTSLYDNDM